MIGDRAALPATHDGPRRGRRARRRAARQVTGRSKPFGGPAQRGKPGRPCSSRSRLVSSTSCPASLAHGAEGPDGLQPAARRGIGIELATRGSRGPSRARARARRRRDRGGEVNTGDPAISVILAAYERAEELDVVLHAFAEQRGPNVEIVVADDGSEGAVGHVVDRWRERLELRHIWQPKEGFRKALALNRAAVTARGDYFVFLDADCVPRQGFWMRSARERDPAGSSRRNGCCSGRTSRDASWTSGFRSGGGRPSVARASTSRGGPARISAFRSATAVARGVRRQPEFVPPVSAYGLIGAPARGLRARERVRRTLRPLERRRGPGSRDPAAPERTPVRLAGVGVDGAPLWHAERTDKSRGREADFRDDAGRRDDRRRDRSSGASRAARGIR